MSTRWFTITLILILVLIAGGGTAYTLLNPTAKALRACKKADQRTGIIGARFACETDVAKKIYKRNPEKGMAMCMKIWTSTGAFEAIARMQCNTLLIEQSPITAEQSSPSSTSASSTNPPTRWKEPPIVVEESVGKISSFDIIKRMQALLEKSGQNVKLSRAIFEVSDDMTWSVFALFINPNDPYREKGYRAYYNLNTRSEFTVNNTIRIQERTITTSSIPKGTAKYVVDLQEVKITPERYLNIIKDRNLYQGVTKKFTLSNKDGILVWEGFSSRFNAITGNPIITP
ncbi:MAG: hypothetical protein Q7S48_04310 [bacterium]|nr:hypothetical protein [bacterium]